MEFQEQYKFYLDLINERLSDYIMLKNTPEKKIYEAMIYSINAGGKRIRPILALGVCEMLGGSREDVLPFACAIEMIHTYSLIHDDLPSMDNDDYRRGRLTNHKVYGDAIAILAGDALLNTAFETMLSANIRHNANQTAIINAMRIIAKASGTSGMIGGQVVDMESEGQKINKELLEYMHKCKTGALIKAPVLAAATLCGADRTTNRLLEDYSEKLGLAFQIKDDLMDIESSFEKMGKKTGSDIENNKSTFVTIYGIEESKKLMNDLSLGALKALDNFEEKSDFLKSLTISLLNREN